MKFLVSWFEMWCIMLYVKYYQLLVRRLIFVKQCSLHFHLSLIKVFIFMLFALGLCTNHPNIGWNNPRNSDQNHKFLAWFINHCHWFIADSPVYEKVCAALTNSSLISGIKQASPLSQTSCLEGFHSVLNHFCPKMIAYSFAGMFCRSV